MKQRVKQMPDYNLEVQGVKNRQMYLYKLENIDLSGTSTFHNPVSSTPRAIYKDR